MSLSDSWLKSAHGKECDKPYEKTDRDGLSVRVSAKGKIVFQMRFRYLGKMQRCDIGTYPLISLKTAREECLRYRAALEKGDDPRIVKAVERMERQNAGTVTELFEQWYKSDVEGHNAQAAKLWSSIDKHLLPTLGHLPAQQITLHHWLGVIEPLAKKTPAMSARLLRLTKQMMRWAVKRNLLESNPLSDFTSVDLNIKRSVGERILSDDDLRRLYEYIETNQQAEPKNLAFIQLCLLYGCRNGELRKAKVADFDFKNRIWTIPAENRKTNKTGKPLLRPIPPEFDDLIKQLIALAPGEYLIPVRDKDEPLTSSASVSLPYKVMNWFQRRQSISMEHWSMHDLRRTARTHFSGLTEPHIAEIMLDHKLPGVWQVYDKHDYLEQQMRAYQAWHRKLMIIIGKAEADNVVEMKRG